MSRKTKILVVDDDRHIAELISLYLNKEGYDSREVYSGDKALEEFEAYAPDLVMLDLMLPGMGGYEVCKEIRKLGAVPVIMLTAKSESFDKVLGLELGADDYVVKPFDPKELMARVKAVLRRYQHETDGAAKQISMKNLLIDPSTYAATYRGRVLEMPPKEFELLYFLASNANRVFTREQLLDKIWGYEFMGDTRTVDVHIKRVREKLDEDEEWGIKTVWGVGYKFEVGEKI